MPKYPRRVDIRKRQRIYPKRKLKFRKRKVQPDASKPHIVVKVENFAGEKSHNTHSEGINSNHTMDNSMFNDERERQGSVTTEKQPKSIMKKLFRLASSSVRGNEVNCNDSFSKLTLTGRISRRFSNFGRRVSTTRQRKQSRGKKDNRKRSSLLTWSTELVQPSTSNDLFNRFTSSSMMNNIKSNFRKYSASNKYDQKVHPEKSSNKSGHEVPEVSSFLPRQKLKDGSSPRQKIFFLCSPRNSFSDIDHVKQSFGKAKHSPIKMYEKKFPAGYGQNSSHFHKLLL